MTTYIPDDVLVFYIPAAAFISDQSSPVASIFFLLFLAACPVITIVGIAERVQRLTGRRLQQKKSRVLTFTAGWEAIASALAFIVWVSMLPGSVVAAHFHSFTSRVGGGAVLAGAVFFPLTARAANLLDVHLEGRAKQVKS